MLVIMCAPCRIMRDVSGPQSAVQITGLIALKRNNEWIFYGEIYMQKYMRYFIYLYTFIILHILCNTIYILRIFLRISILSIILGSITPRPSRPPGNARWFHGSFTTISDSGEFSAVQKFPISCGKRVSSLAEAAHISPEQ
ncbi:hypothetical protein PUN28_010242 [Cardiocondyla obscurior]|uniref:Uncharacterized protein n=1 Tax=Cardiocondyla obscurior TaxID=286306 RepID=A0AAW2FPW0_9HYME